MRSTQGPEAGQGRASWLAGPSEPPGGGGRIVPQHKEGSQASKSDGDFQKTFPEKGPSSAGQAPPKWVSFNPACIGPDVGAH